MHSRLSVLLLFVVMELRLELKSEMTGILATEMAEKEIDQLLKMGMSELMHLQ